MDRWLPSFRAELESGGLLDGVKRLVVAVSGGPDSVCLLELLSEWARVASEPPQLLVGHVHHGIRGADADADADFVERLASERGLELLGERGDARALAIAEGLSLEAAARLLRYRAFRSWARDHSIDAIALGHHFDDQAETVLLRAVRGSGLRGLGGMRRKRSLLDESEHAGGEPRRAVSVIRPLLGWRRARILEFLAERGLTAREDSTNADTTVPRNRVREEILPALETTQPGATASLVRLGEFAQRARADFRELGERAYGEALVEDGAGVVSFDAGSLDSWPVSVLYEVIELARSRLEAAAAETDGRSSRDAPPAAASRGVTALRPFERLLEEITAWRAAGREGGRVIQLGDGLEAELRYGRISVRVGRAGLEGEPPERVALEGFRKGSVARWDAWDFSFDSYELPSNRAGARGRAPEMPGRPGSRWLQGGGAWIERFDLDVLEAAGPLHVRGRREGDVFHPLGAPGRKKLKEFFRECEIEPYRRHRIPLLASGETIHWVVGYRIGHLARCRPETRRVLEVRARRRQHGAPEIRHATS